MIKEIYFILLLMVSTAIFGQEKGSIIIEVDLKQHQFSMTEFNRAISLRRDNIDSYATITDSPDLNDGYGIGLSLNYQLGNIISIGIYSNFTTGTSRTEYNYVTGGEFGEPIDTNYRREIHDLHNLSTGLNVQFFISETNYWKKSKRLTRFEAVVRLEGGYSFGRADFYNSPIEGNSATVKEFNYVNAIHLGTHVKLGYKLMNQNLFSSIGLSLGYNYSKTDRLQGDEYNNYFFSTGNAPKLDFSGFSAGIYLTFGK